jgi:hypothetical protein
MYGGHVWRPYMAKRFVVKHKEKKMTITMKRCCGFVGMAAIALVFGLALASCDGGSSINALLDDYEKVVGEILAFIKETKSSTSDSGDAADVLARMVSAQKKMEAYQEKMENLGNQISSREDEMTEEQTARFLRISFKLAEAME